MNPVAPLARAVARAFGRRGAVTAVSLGENAVFRVDEVSGAVACVRLHRAAGHPRAAIESELRWLDALARDTPLCVPRPRRAVDGARVVAVPDPDGVWRWGSLLDWIEGQPWDPHPDADAQRQIGWALGHLHRHTAGLGRDDFARRVFRPDRALGQSAAVDFAGIEHRLGPARGAALRVTFERARRVLDPLPCAPPHGGLCHGDLRPANLIARAGGPGIIDFDDALFAPFAWDIVTAACAWLDPRRPPSAQLGPLLDGYRAVRTPPPLSDAIVDACAFARHLGVLSWSLGPAAPAVSAAVERAAEALTALGSRVGSVAA